MQKIWCSKLKENQVKVLTEKWLKNLGLTVIKEFEVTGTNGDLVLDFFAHGKINGRNYVVSVECKGDVSLSQLLEGFIRTKLAVFNMSCMGFLAIPHKAVQKLLKYKNFLGHIAKDVMLYDVERNCTIEIDPSPDS